MKLKQIKGLLPEKHQVYGNENVRTKARKENRNRLLDQIGESEVGVDVEVLADLMCENIHGLPLKEMWREGSREYNIFIQSAQSLSASIEKWLVKK